VVRGFTCVGPGLTRNGQSAKQEILYATPVRIAEIIYHGLWHDGQISPQGTTQKSARLLVDPRLTLYANPRQPPQTPPHPSPPPSPLPPCPRTLKSPDKTEILSPDFALDLNPVSPETHATNGNFKNYPKRSRFNGNYQSRRTSISWLMFLSTKVDTACVQMFRAISGTNGDGIWWHDGDGVVSNTE